MTGLAVWPIIAAYLTAGLAYARATLRRWMADPEGLLSDERTVGALGALALGLIWPAAMAFYGLRDWLWRPVDRAQASREQMKTDRDIWRDRERTAATDAERATAHAIVETLDDLLSRTGGRDR